MSRRAKSAFLILTCLCLVPIVGAAEDPTSPPYGRLLRALVGPSLERDHQIALLGFAHVSAVWVDKDIAKTNLAKGRGHNILPQGGVIQDDGINLNQVGLILCKGMGCLLGGNFAPNRNVLSRATPLPAPRGERIIVDWLLSAVYGENAVYWKNKGFDDWKWDADKANRLAFTQWFLDIYLPIWEGVSVLVGSFHTPIANEIGYAFAPPNWFATRTYAFASAPAKFVGVQAQAKIPLAPEFGHASIGVGVAADWNSIELGSGDHTPTFLFEARWRSPDMKTWIDFEGAYGNGEDDFGDSILVDGVSRPLGGGSQYLALSSADEFLARFVATLSILHDLGDGTRLAFESVYGFQEGGDLAPLPFAITRDSAWYGINGAVQYDVARSLDANLRFEWFTDENAANLLWGSVGAGGGSVYAVTLNLAWEANPHLLIRPEIKYDTYDGGAHLFGVGANGLAREDSQFLASLNFDFRF